MSANSITEASAAAATLTFFQCGNQAKLVSSYTYTCAVHRTFLFDDLCLLKQQQFGLASFELGSQDTHDSRDSTRLK
jgi:hypothetical protein